MPFCRRYFSCFCSESDVKNQKQFHRFTRQESSLRGNLVRTHTTSIQDDYFLDLDQELGKGGCGVVVVGERKDTHAQYAIKIVSKGAGVVERARLDRELKLLKDVDHTNIVRLFSVYDDPSYMYFVMELCQGGHLGNLLSRQPLKCVDESWARKLCRQLISAVAHIHDRGIAHRDIKLQNILIDHNHDRTAQLKLIDFGFGSRFVGALPMRTKCGTPYTTAPEVIRESYDERCDVWSVGVVVYIMLCGKRPFEALEIAGPLADAGKASMITNILAGRYHFNHRAWKNVSKEGIAFVKSLLHPDYKTRIHSQEALENPWLSDFSMVATQTMVLKSSKSFRAASNMKRSQDATEMQRTGMLAVVFGLQPKAAAELRSVFQSIDADASGTLCLKEFSKAMNILAPELSGPDISRLFSIIDIDKNNQISYTEFLAATLDPREVDIEELSKAFKLLDEDGNGYITKDEMRRVLTLQYKAANEQEKLALIASINSNPSSPNLKSASFDLFSRSNNNFGDLGFSDAAFAEELAFLAPLQNIEAKMRSVFANADVNKDGVISYQEFLWAMTGMDQYLNGPASLSITNDTSPTHRSNSSSNKYSPIVKIKRRDGSTASIGEEGNGDALLNNMLAVGDVMGSSVDRRRSTDGLALPMRKIDEVSENSPEQCLRSVRLNDSEKLSPPPPSTKHNNSANDSASSNATDSVLPHGMCLPNATISAPAFVGVLAHNSNKEYLSQYGYEQQQVGASVAHPSPPASGAGMRMKSEKNGAFANMNLLEGSFKKDSTLAFYDGPLAINVLGSEDRSVNAHIRSHSLDYELTRGPTLMTPNRSTTIANTSAHQDTNINSNSSEHTFASVNTLTRSQFTAAYNTNQNHSKPGDVDSNWVLSEPAPPPVATASSSSSAKNLTTPLRSKKQSVEHYSELRSEEKSAENALNNDDVINAMSFRNTSIKSTTGSSKKRRKSAAVDRVGGKLLDADLDTEASVMANFSRLLSFGNNNVINHNNNEAVN